MLISLAMSLAAAGTAALPVVPAHPDCAENLQRHLPDARSRPIEDTDLIELLDIGANGSLQPDPVFALSPDQSRIAVAVRRANIASNSYCSGIYIVDRNGKNVLADHGPGAAFWKFDSFYDTHGFPTGVTQVIAPQWSPDGRLLAFPKFVGDRLQLWAWDAAGGSRAIVTDDSDIIDFRFNAEGTSILYKASDDAGPKSALRQESLRGYRFDERFFPFAATTPFPRGSRPYGVKVVRLQDGGIRQATTQEAQAFVQNANAEAGSHYPGLKTEADGVTRLYRTARNGTRSCSSIRCTQVEGLPWIARSGYIRYTRREGWGRRYTAIYEWKGGKDEPVRLFQTDDRLSACVALEEDVLCAREGSTRPRHLARIGFHGRPTLSLFDPNPAFASLRLGRVERLEWTNARGIESFGDLVYPPDYDRKRAYPLIIVQYQTRGFLRGGTGDEFPIQLFARAGYLVLSIERPASPLLGQGLGALERQRRQNDNFMERRSILSTIETKVKQLIALGHVDAGKVGITGLSDGSTTAQFAALHSHLFSAGSVSGCCWEPSQTWLLGSAVQQRYEQVGWPASPDADSPMWSDISLSRNAHRVAFPLLMQTGDSEFYGALEAMRALRASHIPVDLFVFPDEFHIKRYPAHRAHVYHRNLRWFDFWLRDTVQADGEVDVGESAHWIKMRNERPPGSDRLHPERSERN